MHTRTYPGTCIMPKESQRRIARVMTLTRTLGAEHPETVSAKGDYYAAKAAEYVTEVVAKAPPLSDEQKQRVIAALGGAR